MRDKVFDEIMEELVRIGQASIDVVLSGERDEINIDFMSPNEACTYLKGKGATVESDFDTNGWQWDFWINIKLNGIDYRLDGSGYYGDMRFLKVPVPEGEFEEI